MNIIVEKSYYVGHISTNFNQISTCQLVAYRFAIFFFFFVGEMGIGLEKKN